MGLRAWIVLLLLAAVCVAPTAVGGSGRVYTIQLHGGVVQPVFNDSAQIWLLAPAFGFNVQIQLTKRLALTASLQHAQIDNDTCVASFLDIDNDRSNRRWKLTTLSFGPRLYLKERGGLAPFLQAQAAAVLWSVHSRADDARLVVQSSDGGKTDLAATEIAASAAVGLEYQISSQIAFDLTTTLVYFTGLGTDFADWVNDSRSRGIVSAVAGISISFGGRSSSRGSAAELRPRRERESERRVYEVQPQRSPTDSTLMVPLPARVDSASAKIDSDDDGVVDSLDTCPGTAEGIVVDAHGCPDYEVYLRRQVLHALFAPGDTLLRAERGIAVDSVAELLQMFPEVRAAIVCYTDNLGGEDANLKLSQARARSVRDYLVTHRVARERLEAIGRGAVSPIASNRTRAGREQNRRVEIEFRW